jgi:hypothetical protein
MKVEYINYKFTQELFICLINNMEDIKIIYSNFSEIVLLNYFNGNCLNSCNNKKGKFFIENNILKIIWNNTDVEEEYIKTNNEDNIIYYPLKDDKVNDMNYFNDTDIKEKYNKINNEDDVNDMNYFNDTDIKEKYNKINNEDDVNDINPEEIHIHHKLWNDKCIINKDSKKIKRISNNEYANFYINDVMLIIEWEKRNCELFIYKDNNYYHQPLNDFIFKNDILIYHPDWNDYCKIVNINIYRNSNDDKGTFILDENKLIIYWEKWDIEIFYKIDDIFYYEKYIRFFNYEDKNYILNFYNHNIYENKD